MFEVVRSKRFLIAAVAGLALVVGSPLAQQAAAAPAAAYDRGVYFQAQDGSYFSGTIDFYNRSALVVGNFHAVGCKRLYFSTYRDDAGRLDYKSTSTHCNSTTYENVPLKADRPGGADDVLLKMTDRFGNHVIAYDQRR